MNKTDMIDLLNADLANERMHMNFYLYASSVCQGIDRLEAREFFSEAAQNEMKHVREFQDVIVGIGGTLSTNANQYPTGNADVRTLLGIALQMEDEVVTNYFQRINHAEDMGGVIGKYLEIFLEEQLLDSRKDADNIRQMVITGLQGGH